MYNVYSLKFLMSRSLFHIHIYNAHIYRYNFHSISFLCQGLFSMCVCVCVCVCVYNVHRCICNIHSLNDLMSRSLFTHAHTHTHTHTHTCRGPSSVPHTHTVTHTVTHTYTHIHTHTGGHQAGRRHCGYSQVGKGKDCGDSGASRCEHGGRRGHGVPGAGEPLS